MSEIDWSKAPEGADKYNTHNSMFYTGERPYLQVFIHKQWMPSAIIKSNELFVYRPATPSWSGEGLPPAGVDIEVLHELYGWIGARVVGQDGEAAIVRTNDGYAGVFPHQMRPIRTPEQIAADERDAAIKEMTANYAKDYGVLAGWAAYVYDTLGYRKEQK